MNIWNRIKALLPCIIVIALVLCQLNFGLATSAELAANNDVPAVSQSKPAIHKASAQAKMAVDARTAIAAAAVKHNSKLDGKTFRDGTYIGNGAGYRGNIKVRVTIKDGKISKIDVLSTADDPAYFGRAKAVLGRIVGRQSTRVDGVSGATYSSNGLIRAVENALGKAVANDKKFKRNKNKKPSGSKPRTEQADEHSGTEVEEGLKDGIYEGRAWGYVDIIRVQVYVRSGKIEKVDVVEEHDSEDFFPKALAVIEEVLHTQSTDVDTVSGATYSSEGILIAIERALKTDPIKDLPPLEEMPPGEEAVNSDGSRS